MPFFQSLWASLLGCLPFFTLAAPVLVLDSGHTPQQGGALSIQGIYEVIYNDRFVAELKPALEQAGWHVLLTRTPSQNISLAQRADFANQHRANLFLSIHHDSAQAHYLEAITVNQQPAYQTRQPIRGYSLFVSQLNPQFTESQRVAQSLGKQLYQLKRPPTLHHAEAIEGENRPLLHKKYGVYRHDQLAVLRQTTMPAVLLEIGVIVDKQDEAYVSQAANRQAMIQAIVRALQKYQKVSPRTD